MFVDGGVPRQGQVVQPPHHLNVGSARRAGQGTAVPAGGALRSHHGVAEDPHLRERLAHDKVVAKREEYGCSRRDAAYMVALVRLNEVYNRRGIFP